MSKAWRFHPAVAREVEEASGWYEEQRERLGIEFALTVLSVIDTLQAMPTLGSPLRDVPANNTVRRIFVPRFQHAVVFVELPNEYFVVGVPHLRREPGYWLKRLDE